MQDSIVLYPDFEAVLWQLLDVGREMVHERDGR